MTLAAAILVFSVSSLFCVDGALRAQRQSESSPSAPVSQQQSQAEQATPQAAKPSSPQAPAQTSVNKPKESAGNKTHRKKKVVPKSAACDPAANANSHDSSPAPGSAAGGGQTTSPATQTNCPPAKIIVREGGISEQSIQLAGNSSGDKATQKREAANQMLTVTETNLKQLAGRQLNATEQNSISQIRQFMGQSKSAAADGDLERAYTLAWKAKVLSDDLVNPKK